MLLECRQTSGHKTAEGLSAAKDASIILIDGNGLSELSAVVPFLADKIVIDCSRAGSLKNMETTRSTALDLAERCPTARIVKALCSLDLDALQVILRAQRSSNHGVYTSAFYCSNDAGAKQVVIGLLQEASLDPVDCGPLENAPLLDNLGVLESYLPTTLFAKPFAITVVRKPTDRSPLDNWM